MPLKRSDAMTQKKRINPPGTDAEADRSLGTDGGDSHIPASESDRSVAATQASRERDTDVTPSFPPAGIRAGRLFCACARLKQWAAQRSP